MVATESFIFPFVFFLNPYRSFDDFVGRSGRLYIDKVGWMEKRGTSQAYLAPSFYFIDEELLIKIIRNVEKIPITVKSGD